jgi:integrase
MRMRDIMPEQIRQWVTALQAQGVRPRTIQYCKVSILNAIFTTALADEVVTIHPSRGVKTPPVPKKPRRIITAAEFDLLYQALPDADARLLVETDIESGLRGGELTELRLRDLDLATRILTVSRAVVDVPHEEHPSGGRSWSRTTRRTRSTGGSSSAARSRPSSRPTSRPAASDQMTCCSATKPRIGRRPDIAPASSRQQA